MKRVTVSVVTALCLLCVLMLSSLTGCGGNKGSEKPAEAQAEQAEAPAETGEAAEAENAGEQEQAAEEQKNAGGIQEQYEWLSYTLTVDSVQVGTGKEVHDGTMMGYKFTSDDERGIDAIDGTVAAFRILGPEGGILLDDIREEANMTQFVLTDASGQEIPMHCWCWWGVGYTEGSGFGSYDTQEGFLLYYILPDGVAEEDLVLTVKGS